MKNAILSGLAFIAALLFQGCGVYMAFTQPPKVDVESLSTHDLPRDLVIEKLGAPKSSTKNADGTRDEIYEFYEGSSSAWKIGRGVFHLLADVFSLGIWEAVATPTEYAIRGDKISAQAEFDAHDRLQFFTIVGREEKPLERIHREQNRAAVAQAVEEPGTDKENATMPAPELQATDNVHRRVALAFAFGAANWPHLHDVQPNPNIFNPDAVGRPDAWGINIEFAAHARIFHYNRWDVFLGLDLGFMNMENAKTFGTPGTAPPTEKSRLLAQTFYVTPSAKVYYHMDTVRPFIGIGVGGYFLDLSTKTEFGVLVERFVRKDAFGGYASIGIDIPLKWFLLRIEDKFHIVDFGSLGLFSPSSGHLAGPINMIQLGIGITF